MMLEMDPEREIPITISAGGCVISGTLVSGLHYVEHLRDVFGRPPTTVRPGGPRADVASTSLVGALELAYRVYEARQKAIGRSVEEMMANIDDDRAKTDREDSDDPDDGGEQSAPTLLHVKATTPVEGWWRIRIEEIDAFSVGGK